MRLPHGVVTCYFPLQVQYPHVEAFRSPVTQISSMKISSVMALRYGPVTVTLTMLTQCKGFPYVTRGFSTRNANFSPTPVFPATRMSTRVILALLQPPSAQCRHLSIVPKFAHVQVANKPQTHAHLSLFRLWQYCRDNNKTLMLGIISVIRCRAFITIQ